MDGCTATRLLRSRGVSIPIIGVTGNALQEDIETFLRAGANEICVRNNTTQKQRERTEKREQRREKREQREPNSEKNIEREQKKQKRSRVQRPERQRSADSGGSAQPGGF
jgi:CheY-like chemotaxis protein